MKTILIHFDGSCLVNPDGQMGWGCTIESDGSLIELHGGLKPCVGNSNNVAEYNGLILSLENIINEKDCLIDIRGDSKLVINQISGSWKIKEGRYKSVALKARDLIISLAKNNNKFRFKWIPREENYTADQLSNVFHGRKTAPHHQLSSENNTYKSMMKNFVVK